jgi:NO-binding membrane sensor protein with MHYT domain/GGDEF domain-containing protein
VYRVISCIAVQHDYRLVALAALICAAAAVASFKIYSHIAASQGLRRLSFLVLAGVCSALGVWATHFVAMLAYGSGLPTAYDPLVTTASLLGAMIASTAAFAISNSAGRWRPEIGGVIAGLGVAFMHYLGMQALIVPATLHWDTPIVIASLIVGAILAASALCVMHKWSGRGALWVCSGLFTLGVCGLHFTGMGALTILPDPTIVVRPSVIDGTLLAIAVTGATLLVLLSGITSAALMESQMRRLSDQQIRIQDARFKSALDNMGEGLCMFDADKRLVVCNKRYARMYQLPPHLLEAGTAHSAIIAHRVAHGLLKGDTSADAVDQKTSALDQLPADTVSSRTDEMADGRLICVTRQPMPGGGWVATHNDVTAQRRSEAQIAHMASHDPLTGLANRVRLNEALEHALTAARYGHTAAALIIDLDHFKHVNDTLGHGVGDKLLQQVGVRLRSLVRVTDTIARMGGDEFAIIQAELSQLPDVTRTCRADYHIDQRALRN